MLTATDIERKITQHVRQILVAGGKSVDGLCPNQTLTEGLGMDSLEIAGLFINLEDEFKVDPFAEQVSIVDMRTIADMARAYSTLLLETTAV